MSNYEIGYGRPPKATQFKPGVSGNPMGRPKRKQTDLATVIIGVLNAPVRHRDGGQEQTAPAWELNLKVLIQRAVRGDVDAAMAVLRLRIRAERSKGGTRRIEVVDWLPDYPGQTAEDKTRDFARKRNIAAVEWWTQSGIAP